MIRLRRKAKIFINYIVSPLLFVFLTYNIYVKIQNQPSLGESYRALRTIFQGSNIGLVVVIILLSILNWGIEARKWQIIVQRVQRVSLWLAFKSVLAGLALSLFVPNRLGDYVGRVVFMEEGNRLRSMAFTVVAGLAQMIITLVLGVAGLIYLRITLLTPLSITLGLNDFWLQGFTYVMAVISAAFILVYYNLSALTKIVHQLPWVKKYGYLIEAVEHFSTGELTRFLSLSLFRYIVFTVQYLLLFKLLQVQLLWWQAASMVSVFFLVLAVLPTIPIAELGIRGETSLQLFGLLTKNSLGVVATSTAVWGINIIVPAIAGSLCILGFKLFKKPDNDDT
ncbi:MAG: hypothetical protein EAY68_00445 [Bacteroidetes bacterium]|nr:MAG: hypothetical protein EAY68_00445 [Bacteroidota bacterium]